MKMTHQIGAFTVKIEVVRARYPYPYIVIMVDPDNNLTEEGAFQTHMEATLFVENLRQDLDAKEVRE